MTTEQESRLLEIAARRSRATLHDLKERNRPNDLVGNSSVIADWRVIIANVPMGDADLFANAHDDIDWLLSEVKRLNEAVGRARAKAATWVGGSQDPWAGDTDYAREACGDAILDALNGTDS